MQTKQKTNIIGIVTGITLTVIVPDGAKEDKRRVEMEREGERCDGREGEDRKCYHIGKDSNNDKDSISLD